MGTEGTQQLKSSPRSAAVRAGAGAGGGASGLGDDSTFGVAWGEGVHVPTVAVDATSPALVARPAGSPPPLAGGAPPVPSGGDLSVGLRGSAVSGTPWSASGVANAPGSRRKRNPRKSASSHALLRRPRGATPARRKSTGTGRGAPRPAPAWRPTWVLGSDGQDSHGGSVWSDGPPAPGRFAIPSQKDLTERRRQARLARTSAARKSYVDLNGRGVTRPGLLKQADGEVIAETMSMRDMSKVLSRGLPVPQRRSGRKGSRSQAGRYPVSAPPSRPGSSSAVSRTTVTSLLGHGSTETRPFQRQPWLKRDDGSRVWSFRPPSSTQQMVRTMQSLSDPSLFGSGYTDPQLAYAMDGQSLFALSHLGSSVPPHSGRHQSSRSSAASSRPRSSGKRRRRKGKARPLGEPTPGPELESKVKEYYRMLAQPPRATHSAAVPVKESPEEDVATVSALQAAADARAARRKAKADKAKAARGGRIFHWGS